jgi:hypothetical protein
VIHGDIHNALQVTDEFVMDSILSNIFPEICGDKGDQPDSAERKQLIKFNGESIDMERKFQCTSLRTNMSIHHFMSLLIV